MANISDSLKEFINVAGLAAKIKALEAELAVLKSLQSSLGVKTRGRKPGGAAKTPKAQSGKRGKRGALGEAILKFLTPKGKEGAHVKDIAAATGHKPANVTAYFYGTGKKVKGIKKHGGNVFSFVPKEDAKGE